MGGLGLSKLRVLDGWVNGRVMARMREGDDAEMAVKKQQNAANAQAEQQRTTARERRRRRGLVGHTPKTRGRRVEAESAECTPGGTLYFKNM